MDIPWVLVQAPIHRPDPPKRDEGPSDSRSNLHQGFVCPWGRSNEGQSKLGGENLLGFEFGNDVNGRGEEEEEEEQQRERRERVGGVAGR